MKNEWTNFIAGTVGVRIKGKGIERFLNECMRHGVFLAEIKRVDDQCITGRMMLKDLKKARILMRNADCKLYFTRRGGLPFLLKRMAKNVGFVTGLLIFFVILIILSNMVWRIEVRGAQPHTEHQIMKQLEEIGVKKGQLQFLLDNPETIQRKLTDNINNITWIGVEVRGTSYHFQVVEKNEPKPQEQFSPQNIVAKKKAIITDLFVEKGQPLVKVNDFVNKGQPLVSGTIGKEENSEVIAARGKIYGETWYKSEVEIPLNTSFRTLTGTYYTKHYIYAGPLKVPLWAFTKESYKSEKLENVNHPLYFFKWKMPFAYEKVTIREEETIERSYTKEEAVKKGLEIGRNELNTKLDDDAKIKGEKVLHQREENGKVKLSIHYQVIENIAVTQPIIQGD